MDIIVNNPFRVLGVYSNDSAKDIVANVNKAKAYLKVNKEISYDTDFPSLFSPLNRTIDSIDHSQSQINQLLDRIKFSLFWFVKDGSFDEIAMGHLKAKNISKAKEILSKRTSYSSLVNRAVLALNERDLSTALSNYNTLFREYRFRTDFINNICGTNKAKVSEDELLCLLYETILNNFSSVEIIRALEHNGDTISITYVKSKIVSMHIFSINSEISVAKSAENDSESQLRAGNALADNTRSSLQELKAIAEKDEVYEMTDDKLAKQILQCSINYYCSSSDFDKARKAYKLQYYALSIAVGKLTKERCKENVDILVDVINLLPPEELSDELININDKLNIFRSSHKTIYKAKKLIIDCAPYLARIKEVQGSHGKYYLKISTEIAKEALDITILTVNGGLKSQEGLSGLTNYDGIIYLKSILEYAWEVRQYMEVLDLEEDAKKHFKTQKKSLKNLLSQAGVSTNSSVIFKLETETMIFNRCQSKADYNDYLSRFPDGKYTVDAKRKVEEIEKREQEEKVQLISSISTVTRFSDAIALYSECKDNETRYLLDDKCFSLCKSQCNYRKYMNVFGDSAKHASEAQSHLKFDRKIKKAKDYIKEHKGWVISINIVIVIIVGTGLIWGPEGYSGLLYGLGVIAGIVAMGGVKSDETGGCFLRIIAGIICTVCCLGGYAIDEYLIDQKNIESDKVFQLLGSSPSESDCESYITNYPQSSHYNDVMNMYQQAAERIGISSLNSFAKKYNSYDYGKRAATRLEQICDSLYNIANSKGTIDGWKTYINAAPHEYLRIPLKMLEAIDNIAWSTDEKAWRQASLENILSSYQTYLMLYPKGVHYAAADKKVIDLSVADIHARKHGELPAMERSGNRGGYASSIVISNSTSYTLTLLYSGPESKRVTIAPDQNSNVSLKNGIYRVAASVSNTGVRSFAGTENITGGDYNVKYYIVTSN